MVYSREMLPLIILITISGRVTVIQKANVLRTYYLQIQISKSHNLVHHLATYEKKDK